MKFIILFAVLALSLHGEAKRFTRCELVRELRRQGFDENLMSNWVCLIEHESSRYTDKVGKLNNNGSQHFGLFQINDKYWCNNGSTPGKGCNVTCNQLLSDDITAAANCAKEIYRRYNFNAWYGWRNHCQGSLPDISGC